MAKTTKNGTTKAKSVEGEISATLEGAEFALSAEERDNIAKLEAETVRCKVALADSDAQFVRAELIRNEMRANTGKAVQAYVDAVVEAAKAHGIDLEDKTTRWNFDVSTMTFSRAS